MSRVGRKPVPIPAGVEVNIAGTKVSVKGPKGQLDLYLLPQVKVEQEGGELRVKRLGSERDRFARAMHGTTRALLNNMVIGVARGYERKLEVQGVGYSAQLQGNKLVLNVGFSHPVEKEIPSTVTVECPNQTTIIVRGCDKQRVGEFAAEIRKLRPPEPYKGKGIRYSDEIVRRKAGKAFGSS